VINLGPENLGGGGEWRFSAAGGTGEELSQKDRLSDHDKGRRKALDLRLRKEKTWKTISKRFDIKENGVGKCLDHERTVSAL